MREGDTESTVAAMAAEVVAEMERSPPGTSVRDVLAHRANAGDKLAADLLETAPPDFLDRTLHPKPPPQVA